MRPSTPRTDAPVPAIAALFIASGLALPASAADVSWIAGSGGWSDDANWSPFGEPGSSDRAHLGDMPGVSNSTVMLDVGGFWKTLEYLGITSNMTVDANERRIVADRLDLTDGRYIARPVPDGSGHALRAETRIDNGGRLDLINNAEVWFQGDSRSSGIIIGQGKLRIDSTDPFRNNGVLRAVAGNGMEVRAYHSGLNRSIDLDGQFGNGWLDLSNNHSKLTVEASQLTDEFNGTMHMAFGSELTMDIDAGWRAGVGSVINVLGDNRVASSEILGTEATFAGLLQYQGESGRLRVLADAVLEPTVEVDLFNGGWLVFEGAARVNGGHYVGTSGGGLRFKGDTDVYGGTFVEQKDNPGFPALRFNGDTRWFDGIDVDGYASQNGDAQVLGATTINADIFDMDGYGGTVWDIGDRLEVNADVIDDSAEVSAFTGTINVAGGFFPHLQINLTDPNDAWFMNGQMNLAGMTHLVESRVSGSQIIMQGDLNVTEGRVSVQADIWMSNADGGTDVHIADAAELYLDGSTFVPGAVDFTGLGTLSNRGEIAFPESVSLNDLQLENRGHMELGNDSFAAIVSADTFANTSTGVLSFSIGGQVVGTEHDAVLVSGLGGAELAGLIEVDLIDVDGDGAVFTPQVGDEFTVITALGGVSGVFESAPISFASGVAYHWEVEYQPNAVILRLQSIVPSPGTVCLLGLAALGSRRRRV